MNSNKTRIITIANQKGGAGKTTTALNLSAALCKEGYKVLSIDLDQQCNLSKYAGFIPDGKLTISDVLYAAASGSDCDFENVIRTNDEGLDCIPSSRMLASAPGFLAITDNPQGILRKMLSHKFFKKYDYIILDCSPALDLLVTNALVASTDIIIPVQAEIFSVDGLPLIIDTIKRIKRSENPQLEVMGVLMNMVDGRTTLGKEVNQYLRETFGEKIFKTVIPRRQEAVVSTNNCKSLVNTKGSRLGELYIQLALEVACR